MIVTKISSNEPTYRAKISNAVKTAKRNSKRLTKEFNDLKKNLPETTDVKKSKYFGQPASQDGSYEASNADIAVGIGAIAIGLGLALL